MTVAKTKPELSRRARQDLLPEACPAEASFRDGGSHEVFPTGWRKFPRRFGFEPCAPTVDDGENMSSPHEDTAVERVISDHAAAKRRLDTLVNEAKEVGTRFERLGHALRAHPVQTVIGLPEEVSDSRSDWDVVPGHLLPSIKELTALTEDIREAARRVDDLRERLILMGRADLVEAPGEFFQ